jgi:hypothetical protein
MESNRIKLIGQSLNKITETETIKHTLQVTDAEMQKVVPKDTLKPRCSIVEASNTRYAKVMKSSVGLKQVQDYLPKNYSAKEVKTRWWLEGTIYIYGQDNKGWTLDGYVIPRLASALIPVKEVKGFNESVTVSHDGSALVSKMLTEGRKSSRIPKNKLPLDVVSQVEEGKAELAPNAAQLVRRIKVGDRVKILIPAGRGSKGQEWAEKTGKAVMKGPYGWVLNMGGKHGTPGIADDENTVAVRGKTESIEEAREAEFYAWFNNKRITVKASDASEAKQKAIKELRVPKSKVGLLAVMSKAAYEKEEFRYESIEEGAPELNEGWKGYDPDMPVEVVGVRNGKVLGMRGKTEYFSNLEDAQKVYPQLDPDKHSEQFTWVMRGEIDGRPAGRFESWDVYRALSESPDASIEEAAKYFGGSAHKMPASIDDVRGQMLYLYIHQGMTKMLDEIEARIGTKAAPVYESVYKSGFKALELFQPHTTKSGREAVQLWLDVNKKAGFNLSYAPHTLRIMRKYKNDIRNERVKMESIEEKDWSSQVKTKWEPPQGFFTQPAEKKRKQIQARLGHAVGESLDERIFGTPVGMTTGVSNEGREHKSITSDFTSGKMLFSIVDEQTGAVKHVSWQVFKKSKLKNTTHPSVNSKMVRGLAKLISQMRDQVDFNLWVKATNPAFEQAVDKLFTYSGVKMPRGGVKESLDEESLDEHWMQTPHSHAPRGVNAPGAGHIAITPRDDAGRDWNPTIDNFPDDRQLPSGWRRADMSDDGYYWDMERQVRRGLNNPVRFQAESLDEQWIPDDNWEVGFNSGGGRLFNQGAATIGNSGNGRYGELTLDGDSARIGGGFEWDDDAWQARVGGFIQGNTFSDGSGEGGVDGALHNYHIHPGIDASLYRRLGNGWSIGGGLTHVIDPDSLGSLADTTGFLGVKFDGR